MAVVDNITEANSRKDFLEGSQTDTLANNFTSNNISKVASEFKDKVRAELSKGLSVKALSLEGRAPLNDIALEMLSRIDVTIDDIALAKTTTIANGNDHTIKEADRFLKKVLEHYENVICQKVEHALRDCENAHYETDESDGNGGTKKVTHYCHNTITVKHPIAGADTPKITKSGSRDSNSHFDSVYAKFEEAFKAAEDYYDNKVHEAIEFWEYAHVLPVPGINDAPILAIPEGEERPYGVHPDAKKQVITGSNGQIVIYTNPDGSTVEIRKERGKETTHKVKNRYGYTTETIHYNEDGSIDHINKWSYKKVEDAPDHVYEASYTRYELDEKENKWVQTGETTSWGYAYPDKDGNVINRKAEPTADQVGEPISRPGSSKYEQGSLYGMNNSENTTTNDGENNSVPKTSGSSNYYPGTELHGSDKAENADQVLENFLPEKKSFVLKQGDEIFIDGKGNNYFYSADEGQKRIRKDLNGNDILDSNGETIVGKPNQTIKATKDTGDITMKYDENDGVYYPYNSQNELIGDKQQYLNIEDFSSKNDQNGSYIDSDNSVHKVSNYYHKKSIEE